jgi:hypothetical protein
MSMSRFINIYINVVNARKSYIMKRRKYWLGELNSNIWFVFITFVYSSFGQFPCKLLLHIRWRTEIGPTPSWIEIGDKIVWLSHNCLTEMFYDLIQSSGSSKSCCVYYLAIIWKKKFSQACININDSTTGHLHNVNLWFCDWWQG